MTARGSACSLINDMNGTSTAYLALGFLLAHCGLIGWVIILICCLTCLSVDDLDPLREKYRSHVERFTRLWTTTTTAVVHPSRPEQQESVAKPASI